MRSMSGGPVALDDLATFLLYGCALMLWYLLRLRLVNKGLLQDVIDPPAQEPPPPPELVRERQLWALMCVPWLLWAIAEVRLGHIQLPSVSLLPAESSCRWEPGPTKDVRQYVCDDVAAASPKR
jgi:hypothetical protein